MDIHQILMWIDNMKLHRTKTAGIALKKPLLLLLILSKLDERNVENKFYFKDIEKELCFLIKHFGHRASNPKAEQPFHHLNSSPIWNLHTPSSIKLTNKKTIPSSLLRQGSVYGVMNNEAFKLLIADKQNRIITINYILEKHWPQTIQDELRAYFNFSYYSIKPNTKRDSKFAPSVLANYRYKCAMCGFQAYFNQTPFGLDAAHILWHSFEGPDTLNNGLALCKMHHWAFDKGVITVDANHKMKVSKHFIGGDQSSQASIEALDGKMILNPKDIKPNAVYFDWHAKNIFIR